MTSRGELGFPYKSNTKIKGKDGVQRGAYVVHDCYDDLETPVLRPVDTGIDHPVRSKNLPDIVLIGSGQDVALVMQTKELLLKWSRKANESLHKAFAGFPPEMAMQHAQPSDIQVRVVSMPCWELFDEQDQEYQDSVLLSNYDDILRIYVEKAATKNTGHDKYAHYAVLMPSFGLSGKAADVERKLEFTPDYIAAKVWSKWVDRGRRLPTSGAKADTGPQTWVSCMGSRVGSH